jgi:uncharacterized membrane protein affecting hemolysin expression
MDKEVLLAIINGPGNGLTVMVLGVIAAFTIIVVVKLGMRGDFEQGKQVARREGLENLQVTLAKLVHDQADMKNTIVRIPEMMATHPDPDDRDYTT